MPEGISLSVYYMSFMRPVSGGILFGNVLSLVYVFYTLRSSMKVLHDSKFEVKFSLKGIQWLKIYFCVQ